MINNFIIGLVISVTKNSNESQLTYQSPLHDKHDSQNSPQTPNSLASTLENANRNGTNLPHTSSWYFTVHNSFLPSNIVLVFPFFSFSSPFHTVPVANLHFCHFQQTLGGDEKSNIINYPYWIPGMIEKCTRCNGKQTMITCLFMWVNVETPSQQILQYIGCIYIKC